MQAVDRQINWISNVIAVCAYAKSIYTSPDT